MSYYLYMKKLMFQESKMSMSTHWKETEFITLKHNLALIFFNTSPIVNDNVTCI